LHGLGALASTGYRQAMRVILPLLLLLAACSKADDKPASNEQAVIDKANADVMAAEAEAESEAAAAK
jgi:hypothetical protein